MDIKFAQVDVDRKDHLVEAPMTVPGLYNWYRVFKGEFLEYNEIKGRVNEYDIILVALTTWDTKKRLIQNLRDEAGPGVTIVACVDYAPELWQQAFEIEWLIAELDAADILFAPVPTMHGMLSALCPDKPVQRLAHPIDIDAVRNFRVPRIKREKDCGVIVHRYDNYWLNGYVAKRSLPDIPFHVILSDHNLGKSLVPYFKNIAMGGDYAQYVKWMCNRSYALDTYSAIHSMGRFQMDNAILGIPTVGADVVDMQNELWPQLTTGSNEWDTQIGLLDRLHTNSEFWNMCVKEAEELVQSYGYEQSKTRFMEMIDNGLSKIQANDQASETAAQLAG